MAEKIKFTKQEQKKQQDALKQFQRFLPTLQLKKQQLQAEVRRSSDLLEENLRRQEELRGILLFLDLSLKLVRLCEES